MEKETVEDQGGAEESSKEQPIDHKAELSKAQELLKKFEGVDLDKWGRAKDYDFDKAEKAIRAQEARELEEREVAEAKEREQAEKDPVSGLKKDVDGIKQTLAQREAADKQKIQSEWMEKFNKSVDSSIDQALKSEFKDLQELSPQEKKYVIAIVNKAYEDDSFQKTPKLNLETVSKVVGEVVKEVKENRAFLAGKRISGQKHPITPSAQDGALPGSPKTDGERLEAMVNFYKGDREGQV